MGTLVKRDRGAAMPLVVIFVFIVGVTALAVSSLTATSVTYGSVVERVARGNAAAEGVLRDAVQRLADGHDICPATDGTQQSVATYTPRDATASLTCARLGEFTPAGLHFEPPPPAIRYKLAVSTKSGALVTNMRAVVIKEAGTSKVAIDSWRTCPRSGC